MRERVAMGLGVALTLAACGSADRSTADGNAATPTVAPLVSATVPAAAPAAGPTACNGSRLGAAEGALTIAACAAEPARTIAIGSDGDAAVAALGRVIGARGRRAALSECGAGAMDAVDWDNGLQLRVAEGAVIGWSLDRAGIATDRGVAVGSGRRALEAAGPVTMVDSTLGTGFQMGDGENAVSGLLSGPGADARVTHLWSGITCHFT